MKHQQEQIKENLTIFWQSLSSDIQREIGQKVAFTIALLWTSSTIVDITREQLDHLGINSEEFQKAFTLFEELGQDEKLGINRKLSDYFLSRNT